MYAPSVTTYIRAHCDHMSRRYRSEWEESRRPDQQIIVASRQQLPILQMVEGPDESRSRGGRDVVDEERG